jgi:hypothetical protein
MKMAVDMMNYETEAFIREGIRNRQKSAQSNVPVQPAGAAA